MLQLNEVITDSPEQTQKVGSSLGECSQPGDIYLLLGELGAGKTCFTQGIAWGTGFDGYASSPSFVLMRQYEGRLPIFHLDFYRLEGSLEVDDMGLDDYLYGNGVCVIEWADRALESLPQEYMIIRFEHISEHERRLTFEPEGSRYIELLQRARGKWNFQ